MDEIRVSKRENRSMHIPQQIGEYYIQKLIIEVDNSVLVATNEPDNRREKLAIKCIPMRFYNSCKGEPEIMESVKHKNVMKIRRSFLYPPKLPRFFAIVMPRACGDLIDYFPEDGSPVPEKLVCKIMKDSLEGLKAIHAEGICHRDIKLDNIFVLKETKKGPRCAIGDFGYAIRMKGDEITDIGCGTKQYAAPEILEQVNGIIKFRNKCLFSKKTDIWSMGVVMFGLLCGQLPFEINNQYEQNRLLNGDVVFEPYSNDNTKFSHFEFVSEEAKDLIRMLIQKDPAQRPSAEEALNHVWFDALGTIQTYVEEENDHNLDGLSDDNDINELID